MEKKSLSGLCLLFLFLFVAQEVMVHTAEAARCENLADTYRGPCFTNGSCDDHCKNKEHIKQYLSRSIEKYGEEIAQWLVPPLPFPLCCSRSDGAYCRGSEMREPGRHI
ncbi:unnamed protein product [Cuscuta europaea]|uniref:Uncharacterized protein n=1 Tax=Cuscuta europaea TaxID=41803 RepID=A0A9P0ZHV9_CUSEU|nr:unnamed protein product [Cuscuta europaea]CAH9099754.1 unnamed protein product [Cuscuta europaea]